MQASALSKHIHRTIKSTKALLTLDKPPMAKWENLDFISRVSCYTESFQKCKVASAITVLPCFSALWEIREKQWYMKKEPRERSRSGTIDFHTVVLLCNHILFLCMDFPQRFFFFLPLKTSFQLGVPLFSERQKKIARSANWICTGKPSHSPGPCWRYTTEIWFCWSEKKSN